MDTVGFFVTLWFWFVMAFAVGMLLAWLLVGRFVPARTPTEAIEHAVADLREPSDRSPRDRDDQRGSPEPRGSRQPAPGSNDHRVPRATPAESGRAGGATAWEEQR